jgi:cytosine deaminase
MFTLQTFAEEVARHGLSGRATASHCVSLGQQDPARAQRTARALADAGVAVVTLPQTNLWLQGRSHSTRVPRGLTAIGPLREAGVTVAGGGDNWRDPFNPLSRIDPFETAALLVAAAHYSPPDAYAAVSASPRRLMGLPPVEVVVGSPADLLAIRAADVVDAVAAASPDRWVFRSGELVARTRTIDEVDPLEWLARHPAGQTSGAEDLPGALE